MQQEDAVCGRAALLLSKANYLCSSLSGDTPFGLDSPPFWERLQESVTSPAHFHTNLMLTATALEFVALAPYMMHSQVYF